MKNSRGKKNIDLREIERLAADRTSWRNRMEAVHRMKRIKDKRVNDIITYLALHDRVFDVKKEAYNTANRRGIKVNGKPIFLGKKDVGYKIDDFREIFRVIKKKSHMDKINIEKIKEEMKRLNPEMYDVMSHEKKGKFNSWIRSIYGDIRFQD